MLEDIARIQTRYRSLPLLDKRTADQILGYDDRGLPT
jgi:antitoxin VapB